MGKYLIILLTFIFILSNVSAICNPNIRGTCTGMNAKALGQIINSRLQGTDCDCTANTITSFSQLELRCLNPAERNCIQSLHSEVCDLVCNAPIVPEFGILAGSLTILGAWGIFFMVRRSKLCRK